MYSKHTLTDNGICHKSGSRCLQTYNFQDNDLVHNSCYSSVRMPSLPGFYSEIFAAYSATMHGYSNIFSVTNVAYKHLYLGTAPV